MYNFIKTNCANLFALVVAISIVASSCSWFDTVDDSNATADTANSGGTSEPAKKPTITPSTPNTPEPTDAKSIDGNATGENKTEDEEKGFFAKHPVITATGLGTLIGAAAGAAGAAIAAGVSSLTPVAQCFNLTSYVNPNWAAFGVITAIAAGGGLVISGIGYGIYKLVKRRKENTKATDDVEVEGDASAITTPTNTKK